MHEAQDVMITSTLAYFAYSMNRSQKSYLGMASSIPLNIKLTLCLKLLPLQRKVKREMPLYSLALIWLSEVVWRCIAFIHVERLDCIYNQILHNMSACFLW